ncbi:MAG: metallopeptidase family protein [Deltaproteobacteria bacterium]|nr:metallopeptidase family protein [Deltaproteobacteria bacterium]MDQ3300674.1 metallopeptidase family protein [Myxococcota bacterium]
MRRALALAVLCAACKGSEPTPAPPLAGSAATPASLAAAAATAPKPLHEHPIRPHHEGTVVECPGEIDETMEDDAKLAVLLDTANKQIVAASFAAAWTCADRAADLVPTSVEAHHLRGAALAALGRDGEAQLAYALALSLDPDDPETLRAVADFYINGKGERGRDALRLGLELAQRGSRRVLARRRRNPPLAADLALLEGQALNDLGRSDEALGRLEVALRIAPGRGDALHEKGVALFDLSRFADAKAAFTRALTIQPDDPFSHQMLGLTLEQLGDTAGAERELARARELAPTELVGPIEVTAAEFQREVDAVIESLPAERQARVRAIRIELVDLPDPLDLAAVKPPFPPTILGLYRGPVGKGAHVAPLANGETPSIVLYRKNLVRAVKTRRELSEQIRDTLLHEIGHLEGLDEDDLRRRGME